MSKVQNINPGEGNLTFQVNNTNVAAVQQILAEGGSVDDMTFSDALFTGQNTNPTAIPEPLTILGAGAALGFGGFFKKKVNKGKSAKKTAKS